MRKSTPGSYPLFLATLTIPWYATLPPLSLSSASFSTPPFESQNWSRWKRWYITALGGILVLNSFVHQLLQSVSSQPIRALRTFASAAPSGLLPAMMERFGFGDEVATLTVSLFIAGYCLGPLVWGPLSEDVSCFKLSRRWYPSNSLLRSGGAQSS